ncbi:hypothetical protein LOD99_6889 [Oopsacas minuta]|uniref:Uncharacterized protein n=1 Tax=Oopsacas minuta TaxID=111878 RepID=A0AAV7JJB3_9METZ|nr:hypothetical protein LOD99_6889 [Oopsacas minuta]
MHDTLFTSNTLHSYSSSQFSDPEFLPQDYTLPYLGHQKLQPALDHLNPYYQGFFDPLQGGENLSSNRTHSNSMFSASISNNSICDISLPDPTNIFTPILPEQTVSRDVNEPFHQPLQATQIYSSLEKGSLNGYVLSPSSKYVSK